MFQWIRRSFIAGFFMTVPLVISVAAFVWIFRLIDGFVGPYYEAYLQRVPVFRTIYAPVKQLVVAFSPDNEYGFKRVVLIEDTARGFVLGFLTKEFIVDRGQGTESLVAVY